MNGLNVVRRGSGRKALVALHGWSGDHRAFAPLLRYLPDDYELIAVDQPGCGASASPDTWTTDAIAAPIAALIRSLDHEEISIVGACSGAVVGMQVTLQAREHVDRLIMIDPFLTAPWYFSLFTRGWLGAFFYFCTFANPLGRLITNRAVRAGGRKNREMTRGFDRLRHWDALRYLKALHDTPRPSAEALADLDPILDIAVGENTFQAVRRSVEAFRRTYWPTATLTVLPGAGHLPLVEAPKLVATRVVWKDHTTRMRRTRCLP